MEIKDVHIWKPVSFSENWERCSTSRLDVLLPSWVRKRETLKEDANEYVVFMNRLKRQHAIETGVIEKLYDLSEGITETFIKEGFVESYLQHGDTNIPPGQLMAYLQDNFDALDFVFDVVKNNRPLSKSFIKELHALITQHQHTAEGHDQFGNRRQIPLIKGAFKEWENNPTRADGTRFVYCPPVHVEAEMDRLVEILAELEERRVKPLLMATWLHHAFVTIHPFQDGNGRVARMISSLVLIKHGLFPLTVKREGKKRYIDALESADEDKPQALVDYFGEAQNKNIEAALNLKLEVELATTSLSQMAEILTKKLESQHLQQHTEKERQLKLQESRLFIFRNCEKIMEEIKADLETNMNGNAVFTISSTWQNLSHKLFVYRNETAEYANRFGYFYNQKLPGAVLCFNVALRNKKNFRLVISLHHLGYDESTWAIAPILINQDMTKNQPTPIIEPYLLSLESDHNVLENTFDDLKTYLQNAMTLTLAQIASEIYP